LFRRANELWRGPFEMHHPDQLGLEVAGIGEQHDRVVVNLNDKRRDIIRLVGLRAACRAR